MVPARMKVPLMFVESVTDVFMLGFVDPILGEWTSVCPLWMWSVEGDQEC